MIEWRREPFPRLPFEIGNIVTVAGASHARQASPVRHLLPRCPDVSTVTISVPNPSGDLESHRQCMWSAGEVGIEPLNIDGHRLEHREARKGRFQRRPGFHSAQLITQANMRPLPE